MKLSIYNSTKYILGILINVFNAFAKNKYELKWLASFPKYFNTIIKPKELILFKLNKVFKGQIENQLTPWPFNIPLSSLRWWNQTTQSWAKHSR